MQRADAITVRLDLAKLITFEEAQALDAVGQAALMQGMQTWDFVGRGRHHQLAAFFKGNRVFQAEALHGGATSDAVARLERASAVVNAGVDHSAVVAGLVGGDAVFFLDNQQALAGKAAGIFEGGGEPDDAGSDDEKICLAINHRDPLERTVDYT